MSTEEFSDLGQRLATVLELRGMSQQRLEKAAELSRGYVSRMKRGQRERISAPILQRMADALGVSYEWLATGRGDMGLAELPEAPQTATPNRAGALGNLKPRGMGRPGPGTNRRPGPGSTGIVASTGRGIGSPPADTVEVAVAYHQGRWSKAAIAAARELAAEEGAPARTPPQWAEVLDQIEATLQEIRRDDAE